MSLSARKFSPFVSSFLGYAFAGGLAFLVFACVANEPAQIALLGFLISFCAILGVAEFQEQKTARRDFREALRMLPVPFALSREPGFIVGYEKMAESLTTIVQHRDRLFLELAGHRIESAAADMATLAKGEIVFEGTETWRAAYQRVLETMRVKTYYSVAWVRTNEYWNDAPGRQSMRFNFELKERGFRIERVHILPDELWPFEEKMPTTGILEWLVEQQGHGIVVSLIRESDLANEPDLLRDFAIYGDRAVGTQELDEESRTVRFVLSFDQPSIRQSLDCWERLTLYSVSFQGLIDRLQK